MRLGPGEIRGEFTDDVDQLAVRLRAGPQEHRPRPRFFRAALQRQHQPEADEVSRAETDVTAKFTGTSSSICPFRRQ